MFFFKGNTKTSNKEKIQCCQFACWKSRISQENGMPVHNVAKHKLLWLNDYLVLLKH